MYKRQDQRWFRHQGGGWHRRNGGGWRSGAAVPAGGGGEAVGPIRGRVGVVAGADTLGRMTCGHDRHGGVEHRGVAAPGEARCV